MQGNNNTGKHICNKEKYMGTITQSDFDKRLLTSMYKFYTIDWKNKVCYFQKVKLDDSGKKFINVGYNEKYDIID